MPRPRAEPRPDRLTAIYCRVSTTRQDHASQEPDLTRWTNAYAADEPVEWYRDTASGKDLKRPGWQRLWADMQTGRVSRLVVWRLDRLGRDVSDASTLFKYFARTGINLVSLKEGIDLSTPAGMMMANVIASFAQYEKEIIGERIKAGIAAATARGQHHGRKPGSKVDPSKLKINADKRALFFRLLDEGSKVAPACRAVGIGRTRAYELISERSPSASPTG